MHNYYETLRPIIRDYIRSADHPALPTNYDYHITDNATIRILYQPSYFEIEIRAELRYLSFDYKRKVEYDDYVGINIERFLIPAYQIDRNPAIITKFFDTCIRAFDIASYLTDFIRLYFFDEDIHTFIDFEADTESPRIKILVKKYIGTDPDFARKIYKRLAYLELSRPEFYTLSNDTILHYIISLLKQNSTS
ncbi:MAG: hypothetical protein DRH04_05695 [Deltaproteobacteria bacterium]|nr:MAG: hypothetical protein DRH04_05695 [Deltaproteobacteria bacterium]